MNAEAGSNPRALQFARELADVVETNNPELAAAIRARVDEVVAGQRAQLNITITECVKVEKFIGDVEEGKKPFEVIETERDETL